MNSWCSGQDVDLALGNTSKLLLHFQAVLPLGAPWHGSCPHPVPLRQGSSQQHGHLPTAVFGREIQQEWGYCTLEIIKLTNGKGLFVTTNGKKSSVCSELLLELAVL